MSDAMQESSIRFYFSFRSPYAWLAAERLESELLDLGVPVESVPIFPTPGAFPNDPSLVPNKARYIAQDIPRLARELGLKIRYPPSLDTDWAFPHAAFLAAEKHGAGTRFMVEAFRKRYCEGLDLGEDAVVGDAAKRAGLDPSAIVSAGHSGELRAEVSSAWSRAVDRDGIFGVPSFTYAGRLYWGQDRMRFVRSAVERKAAKGA